MLKRTKTTILKNKRISEIIAGLFENKLNNPTLPAPRFLKLIVFRTLFAKNNNVYAKINDNQKVIPRTITLILFVLLDKSEAKAYIASSLTNNASLI